VIAVIKFFQEFRDRFVAQRVAREACARLMPNEPILGTALCANEPDRYVVRVFCGKRDPYVERLPPWTDCKVFVVPNNGGPIQQVDDAKYCPTLR
jgi:hypothetical protein